MKNNRLNYFIYSALLFIGAVWFFRDGFKPGLVLFGDDTVMLDIPFRMLAKEAFFKYHSLPLWMININMGMPLLDSSNLICFYPLNFIFLLLPLPVYSMHVFDIIIHMMLAALGMFLFLNERGLKKEASFFGGLVFMTSGAFLSFVNVGHWGNIQAAAFIPYVFYFLSRGVRRKSLFDFMSAALFMGLQITCMGMQIMAYTALGALFYIIYELFFNDKTTKEKIFIAAAFSSTGIFLIMFSALQFFPSLEYTKYSWRGKMLYENFIGWSMHPLESLTFIMPQFFGLMRETYWGFMQFNMTTYYFGILPFILLPFAFVFKTGKRLPLFFAVSAGIFLILGFGGYTPLYNLFYYIPIFNNFRTPSRFLYIFTFFIITLAAFGLNNILLMLENPQYKKELKGNGLFTIWWKTAVVAAAAAVILLGITSESVLIRQLSKWHEAVRNTAIDNGIFSAVVEMIKTDGYVFGALVFFILAAIILAIRKKFITSAFVLTLVLCGLQFADVARVEKKFINYQNMEFIAPTTDPVMAYLKAEKAPVRAAYLGEALMPNTHIYYNLEFLTGYHGNSMADIEKFMASGVLANINVSRLFNVGYYFVPEDMQVPGLVKVFDGKDKLYKDTQVGPRFVMLDKVKKFGSKEAALDFMKTQAFDPGCALVTEDIAIKETPEKLKYAVQINEYTPGRVKLAVDSNKEGLLANVSSYYHRWKVKVDGKEDKIYNIDYMIMGVKLPAGKHTVEFYYSADYLLMPLGLTLLVFLLYGAVYIYERKKRKLSQK